MVVKDVREKTYSYRPPKPSVEQSQNVWSAVKEKNLYALQTPSVHPVSPNKPIIQVEDLSSSRSYFDICLSSCIADASERTSHEFSIMLDKQYNLHCLHTLGTDVVDWIIRILSWNQKNMFKKLGDVPDVPFLNFVEFSMVDFLLNCMKPGIYQINDERSPYWEIFIPLFKVFGNTASKLNYAWYEKKAKDLYSLLLLFHNFKMEKGNIKPLDGVGRLVDVIMS
ncbi:uncharacterized protein EV154DRAFT_518614 [Mucor mucedo]|uniref:uncharacterized protein n=1 Tax=Mucor mucedo TaxID=29922 RepID=UPI00221F3CE9|nr:uncharacterized protein EV154DRAFT_518614 [Mucor mucedo]KAI7888078.1 hypothetical protein EV154DRAFT_518614 [Mucor mucedo]